MKERPILFSAPMVRAVLAGTKTQTRRLVVPSPGLQRTWLDGETIGRVPHGEMKCGGWQMHHPLAGQTLNGIAVEHDSPLGWVRCPYGAPGDRLWVRETHAIGTAHAPDDYPHVHFAADVARHHHDGASICRDADTPAAKPFEGPWKPSIHMPRWASRLDLEVTSVRVERLQDISHSDAIAEGIFGDGNYATEPPLPYPVATFKKLWESINGERAAWASNPWVWVVSFERVQAKERAA